MNDTRIDRRAFLGTLAALGISAPSWFRAARADDAKPDPSALAKKVEAAYASCKTYRDSGKLVQTFVGPGGKDLLGAPQTATVSTAFERPGKFRFAFNNEVGGKPILNLIGMDGPAVKSWWGVRPGVERPESLAFALGAAVGVTGSSSMVVAPLLLPKLLGRPNALSVGDGELILLEDEAIGPVACRRLRRTNKALNFQTRKEFEIISTYWIDAKTFAIRRFVQEMRLDEGRAVGTLDLVPEFDAEIPAKALEFDPPTKP